MKLLAIPVTALMLAGTAALTSASAAPAGMAGNAIHSAAQNAGEGVVEQVNSRRHHHHRRHHTHRRHHHHGR